MPSYANRNTRLIALARKEYFSAIRWYKRKSSEAVAERFMLEVEQTLALIRRSPNIFPLVFRDRRRALLQVFPFQIIFVQVENVLVVIGVVHNSRNPSYWQKRLLPDEEASQN